MELSGEIEDLPAINLLQYLYSGRKYGTLVLDSIDEELYVYYQGGEIIWTASRNGKSIADIFLDRKKISIDIFQEAQKVQNDQNKIEPLPQILIDMAIITLDQLKDEIHIQVKQNITELTKREKGEVSFKNNQILPLDNIDFNIVSLLKPDDMDTQNLLGNIIQNLNGDNKNKDDKNPSEQETERPLPTPKHWGPQLA